MLNAVRVIRLFRKTTRDIYRLSSIFWFHKGVSVSFYVSGLNRDRWHSVTVTIDVHGARLIAKVGDQTQETLIQGLHPSRNYDVASDLESVVLIGGQFLLYKRYLKSRNVSSRSDLRSGSRVRFSGCTRDKRGSRWKIKATFEGPMRATVGT